MNEDDSEREFFLLVFGHYVLVELDLGDATDHRDNDDSNGEKDMVRGQVQDGLVEEVAEVQNEVAENDPENGQEVERRG